MPLVDSAKVTPIDWLVAQHFQLRICFGEALAAEEPVGTQGRRMGGLDHSVLPLVHQCLLAMGESAPEQEHDALLGLLTDKLDNGIGESLPANVFVGICLMCLHSQRCVQQENTLFGPRL